MRLIARVSLLCLLLVLPGPFLAQSPTGTVSGQVLDPDGRAIAGAEILVVNDLTGLQYMGKSNEDGIYMVTNLPPGPYRIQVSKIGFKAIIKPDIILNVQDALSVNFKLPVGAASIVVTVPGGAPMINTTDGSVSTVVDRKFIENMPLNGRSFQDLILLTPGINSITPQANAQAVGSTGEFSVNGQRTESNAYTVDGVSANIGISPGSVTSPGPSGSIPAASALGTTQALVSVDALEEFRVQSSSYSAEYGRTPGGQFSFATRSGTNQWHGTAFDYLRNNVLDANDWFNDYYGVQEPALRQNDFGGTLGGPVEVPNVYDGKNKSFFFFSYEGLRLLQPQPAAISYVPSAELRQDSTGAIQSVLEAFPLPACPLSHTPCSTDLGNGLGEFFGSWSNPGSLDSYSIRLDQTVKEKARLFFRFSSTPSNSTSRPPYNPALEFAEINKTRTYTAGVNVGVSSRFSNDFRFSYASNSARQDTKSDGFGGSRPVNLFALSGLTADTSTPSVSFQLAFPGYSAVDVIQQRYSSAQRQWNAIDAVTLSTGRQVLKVGFDLRRLEPSINQINPEILYYFYSEASVLAGQFDSASVVSQIAAYPSYMNFSAFAQDEWHVSPRLALSFGLRLEVDPAPGAWKGNPPYTVRGNTINDLVLAPIGTPLWDTSWHNVAPRIGVAYILRRRASFETVVRAGGGVFFDTGQQAGSFGYAGPGMSSFASYADLSFPLSVSQASPPIVNPPVVPYTTVYAFPEHLQLPYTWQWSGTVEQSLGSAQVLKVSYVGAGGRKLLEQSLLNISSFNPRFTFATFIQNGPTSDYNALQVQFNRRLHAGLQALASYTWSHSIDYGSQSTSLPELRGNSDFDVRNNFSAALSYAVPNRIHNGIAHAALKEWSLDDRLTIRGGFPVTLGGPFFVDPVTGNENFAGLNVIPGQPIYLYGPNYPGGRAINPNAFGPPPGCLPFFCPVPAVGDAPRNFVRGFGAWQTDLAVRRDFALFEGLKLQFRAEAFNVFNHPNFGYINSSFGTPQFGLATETLANSLATLNPLYQMGGSRSMQFALKLIF